MKTPNSPGRFLLIASFVFLGLLGGFTILRTIRPDLSVASLSPFDPPASSGERPPAVSVQPPAPPAVQPQSIETMPQLPKLDLMNGFMRSYMETQMREQFKGLGLTEKEQDAAVAASLKMTTAIFESVQEPGRDGKFPDTENMFGEFLREELSPESVERVQVAMKKLQERENTKLAGGIAALMKEHLALTDEQTQKVTAALVAVNTSQQETYSEFSEKKLSIKEILQLGDTVAKERRTRITEAFRPILTPDQFAAFEKEPDRYAGLLGMPPMADSASKLEAMKEAVHLDPNEQQHAEELMAAHSVKELIELEKLLGPERWKKYQALLEERKKNQNDDMIFSHSSEIAKTHGMSEAEKSTLIKSVRSAADLSNQKTETLIEQTSTADLGQIGVFSNKLLTIRRETLREEIRRAFPKDRADALLADQAAFERLVLVIMQ